MKFRLLLAAASVLAFVSPAFALDGNITIHDPSTIVMSDGKFFTYGTGGGGLMSDDGWTWAGGAQRGGPGGLAPDVIRLGDRYCLYVATQDVQPRAEIHMLSSKSLNPASPDFVWEDGGIVSSTDGVEDCNGIDPGVFLDPKTGRLWLTYGSYFGYIRLVELDAKSGKRLHPGDKPVDLAVNCEASVMTYHDGWY
ncbi:MAG: family 43 glycosylhydrolase, partial [Verrucomicrobiota bacterium]